MKKYGFFGGTFDPIHFGHIHLALDLLEKHHLDEVVFCPAYVSPFKRERQPVASGENRLEMVKLAIAPIASFSLTSYELEKMGSNFTIDTLRALSHRDPSIKWHLLLGEDQLQGLSKWKEIDQLKVLAPPLVGSRYQGVSSTEIRKRLNQGLYCGHLIPEQVADYCMKKRLY